MSTEQDISCTVREAMLNAGEAVHNEIASRINPIYGLIKLVIALMVFIAVLLIGVMVFIHEEGKDTRCAEVEVRYVEVKTKQVKGIINLTKFRLINTEVKHCKLYSRYVYRHNGIEEYYTKISRNRKLKYD